MALGKPFKVLSLIGQSDKFSILLTHRNKEDALLFESNAVAQLTAAEVQIVKKNYKPMIDSFYGCLGVLQFYPEDDQQLFLVMVSGCVSVGKIGESEIFRLTQASFINLRSPSPDDDKVSEVKKVLNSGTFYFTWSGSGEPIDLTLCEQKRTFTKETDNRFFWNRTMFLHLLRFGVDCNDWLLKVTCGSVEIKTVYAGVKNVKAAIVSRLSCERAGTRFNVRGTNDEGHVANFVETEQILATESEISSFLQTRGSVPLFWEQPGVQVGSHKVRLSRGPEASCSALSKHLSILKDRYGKQVIVNLLGSSLVGAKEGEATLSSLFHTQHTTDANHADIPHILFDYHQEVRGNRGLDKLEHKVQPYLAEFKFFYTKDGTVDRIQNGTIRTNCLDCLDRTNCVQTFFGLKTLEGQLRAMGLLEKSQNYTRFEEVFRQMWINNGNEVSKIYAGTGAIQGSSKLMDGARSAARTIQNNLLDQSKQEAIDVLLLGHTFNTELTSYARSLLPSHYLHAPPLVLRAMVRRWEDYTVQKPLTVIVGTYNVNGGKHFRSVVYKDLSLSDWLLDAAKIARSSSLVTLEDDGELDSPGDIYAVGFQEIVDLNAGNIVAASSENKKAWGEELEKILNRDRGYVLLTSLQLVGVCLYVFVRPQLIPHIKDVATDSVKTGLGGAAGNKGAVALRVVVYSTSMCFVCSHFAAGQSQVKERCDDYSEIKRKVLFPMGRSLESHDYIFWCGDFNFRIDQDREEVRENVGRQDWPALLQKDQLSMERERGNVFEGYQEGEINFAPTYKYDLFSEDYDTSEKCRVPAWTDRVLWRRRTPLKENYEPPDWNPGKCLHYGRAELKQSDHRPVVAVIQVDAFGVDEKRRDQVFSEVIKQFGPPDATVILGSEDSSVFYCEDADEIILHELSGCGDVILVRHLGEELWVTFSDGLAALAASRLQTIQVGNYIVHIRLKTEDWKNHLEKEMALCINNNIPLLPSSYNNNSVQLKTCVDPIEDYGVETMQHTSLLGSAPPSTNTKDGKPPSRPPPPRSPATERKLMLNDGGSGPPSAISSNRQSPTEPSLPARVSPLPAPMTPTRVSPTQAHPPVPPRQSSTQSDPPTPQDSPTRSQAHQPNVPSIPPRGAGLPPVPSRAGNGATATTNFPPVPSRQGGPPPIPARQGGPPPSGGIIAPAIPPRK